MPSDEEAFIEHLGAEQIIQLDGSLLDRLS